MDMACNITHFADDNFVFLVGLMALFALFAIGALPLSLSFAN